MISARPPHADAPPAALARDAAHDAASDEIAAIAATCGLTLRQAAVARLVARGMTNLQIAAALGISRYTARNHVADVLARLAVTSRRRVAGVLGARATAGR